VSPFVGRVLPESVPSDDDHGSALGRVLNRAAPSPSTLLSASLAPFLHLDDPWVVDVVLGAIVANMEGDAAPLWLLIVGPPSTAKTELVQLFRGLKECDWLPHVTENTFLSGLRAPTKGGQTRRAPEHSLLFRLTDPNLRGGKPPVRVLLIQDLTSLISERREKRDRVLADLREIYDGRLTKATGVGDDLLWEGYLGLLGAVTQKYDDVAELHSILGDRFVLYRPRRVDHQAEAVAALKRGADDWRAWTADIAKRVVRRASLTLPAVSLSEPVMARLISLARLTAAMRAGVVRDGYSKAIRMLPEAEGPSRLVQQFAKLLRGLCAARGVAEPSESELAVLAKVARNTVPAMRLQVLAAIHQEGSLTKAALASRIGLPPTTLEYLLQDQVALGVLHASGQGRARAFELGGSWRELADGSGFFATSHEM
jgi:hypothetical protein